jgi:hypothetical protein
MAQTNNTIIQLYYSPTPSAMPNAANLSYGELALNIVDGKLYFKDSTNTVSVLASTAGASGTVQSVAVTAANGFNGTVSNATTNPNITLTTTVTGILKGNGTAMSAASAGIDYAPATSGSAILKGNGSGGFSSATSGTDYAPATSGTSILKGNGSGGFSAATAGVDYAPATTTTSILYGNGSGGFANVAIGSGLSFVSGTLSASGGGSGINGTYHDVTGSRSFNTTYYNTTGNTIAVAASTTCSTSSNIRAYVDGIQVNFWQWQFNGCGAFGGTYLLVPNGSSYYLASGQGVQNWVELY